MKAFDFDKEYGVVLEGGGAKGAYQIGVWKAMQECGVKIKGVSGVSVGALNGAMICMGDYENAEKIWENISYSQVMNVNDVQMESLMKGNLKDLDLGQVTKQAAEILTDGGFDVGPLKEMIEEFLDEEKIKNSEVEFVLGTLWLSKMKEVEITAQDAPEGYLKDYLLASAYFPAFKIEKIHGRTYVDGGIINNIPVDLLMKRGYKNIIVIRIYGLGLAKRIKIPKDVNIIEIAPRVSLGNILEFDRKRSRNNLKIGYFDGMRTFRGLEGKIYYLDETGDEEEYLEHFVKMHTAAKMLLIEYFAGDYTNPDIYTRQIFELALPAAANLLKLNKKWTYKELYLSMLELCAKYLRVSKYKIYKEKELLNLVKSKYYSRTEKRKRSQEFVEIIMKVMSII